MHRPQILPSADNPTSFSVKSVANSPKMELALTKTPGPGQPAAYSGSLLATVGSKPVTFKVQASWNRATSTVRGSYISPSNAGGSFSLILKAPSGS